MSLSQIYQVPCLKNKIYWWLILPLFCFGNIAFANQPEGFLKVEKWLEQAWEYRSTDIDSMEWYLLRTLTKSKEIQYETGEGKALNFLGFRHFVIGEHDRAIERLIQAGKILKRINDVENLAQNENFLGLVYWTKEELDKALIHQLEFLNLGTELQDKIKLADAYLNIGAIYKSCKEFLLAEEYLRKGLAAHQDIKNTEGIGYCLHHLGGVYFQLKKLQQSFDFFEQAIATWEANGDKRGMGYSYTELGILVLEIRHERSLPILEKAVELTQQFGQNGTLAGALHNLGCYYFRADNWEIAEPYFEESLVLARKNQVHHVIADNASKLSLIHERRNNWGKANFLLRLQLAHRDSLNAKNQKDTRDWLIAKNELEQERLENDYLKSKEMINQEKLKNQRIIGSGLVFILLLLGVFTWYFYKNHQKSKRINRQLQALNQTIREKNQAIEAQSVQLQHINRELEDFTAIASHDMKEPLRMILSFGKLLQRRFKEDEKATEFLHFIVDAGERMSNLLQNLLDYARSGGQIVEAEIVDLNEVLVMVQQNLMIKIQESKAQVTVENHLPIVLGNKEPLLQLFQNLIGNALKFQPKDQQPFIQIASKTTKSKVQVFVKDNGIGISKQHLGTIFEPFKKLHTRTEYDGSGLGLATCKKVMKGLDGNIEVFSKEGTGTTFVVTIPLPTLEKKGRKIKQSTISTAP